MQVNKQGPRIITFAFSVALIFFACASHWTQFAVDHKTYCMILSYGLIFAGCVGSWLSFPSKWSYKQQLLTILSVSVVARILIMGMPASDDVNRYLWEGKIILAGESPYANPADHDDFIELRDSYWLGMNHKDKLTAYPPLAELIFAAISYTSYTPLAYKLFFLAFDIATLCLLILLLRQKGLHIRSSLLYALNPITLFGIAGEAHFDAMLIMFTILSLFCIERKSFAGAWIYLGIAIQIKIVAVILVPLYLIHSNWKKSWLILLPLFLPSIYFIDTIQGMINGLLSFGGGNSFNSPVHQIIYSLTGNMHLASYVVYALFASISLWVLWAVRLPLRAASILFTSLVILSPIVHYWYILWCIPFLALSPRLSWLALSFTSGAYFTSTWSVTHGQEWTLPVWAMWVQWLPFAILLLYELRMVVISRFKPYKLWSEPKTVSIVIPTLNEGKKIKSCIDSIHASEYQANEIIVCDGGSTDNTLSVAENRNCQIINCPPGRGKQIKTGTEIATSDIILILHADCLVPKTAINRILQLMKNNRDIVGGALGQRFSTPSLRMLIIEVINDARATLGGCSFGDQGQFFRKDAAKAWGGFPDYPLMEDVEQSLRMMTNGRVVLLGDELISSARQWNADSFLRRIGLILKLIIKYRVSRLFGRDITPELYATYYKMVPEGRVELPTNGL